MKKEKSTGKIVAFMIAGWLIIAGIFSVVQEYKILRDYTFSCTVVTGAPALAGLEQRLVCRYRPCGLETLPALFCCIIGIASFAAAGIILLVVLIVTKRKKRGQTTASSGTESKDKHEA